MENRVFKRDGVGLRCLVFGYGRKKILFLPGWASTEYTWRHVIPILSDRYQVHYLESREKAHTQFLIDDYDLSIESAGDDLIAYLDQLDGIHALIGASVGATVILQAWHKIVSPPEHLVLICPNLRVRLPRCFKILRIVPTWTLRGVRPVALKAIEHFSFGADGEKIAGLVRKSAVALSRVDLQAEVAGMIEARTLIIAATNDGTHEYDDAVSLAEANAEFELLKVKSFAEAHSSLVGHAIVKWIEQQDGE